jgi:hypothetical protein
MNRRPAPPEYRPPPPMPSEQTVKLGLRDLCTLVSLGGGLLAAVVLLYSRIAALETLVSAQQQAIAELRIEIRDQRRREN